jgi:outer membrane lipoprotein carrier protein
VFLACVHGFAQDDAASAGAPGVRALEDFVSDVDSFSADFEEEIWTADQQLFERAAGTMSLKRPNRFFWHYRTPIETYVVADGKRLWMYDVELAQVLVTPLGDTEATPAMLLSGDQDLRESFDVVDAFSVDDRDWVRLEPKSVGGDFSSILLGFSDGLPRQLEFVNGLDQTARIQFSNTEVNPVLDDVVFEFTPPAEADVIGNLE